MALTVRWLIVRVVLGGLRGGVAHPVLDRAQRDAGGGHAGAEGVAQLVEGDLADPCSFGGSLEATHEL
jgi:hypothetical protein